ncbi:MAG: hypothetical protein FD164_902 [Nitrospirae bacterium]|nr:MAG: hypothetical protein FD164_902 [Nitrospirota bacterium]
MSQSMRMPEESSEKRLAEYSLKINKYILSLPLLVVFFLLFPDNPILARNTEKSLGMLLIGSGLLSYPLVFAVGRTLAKQRYERGEYRGSIYMSWLPVICIALVVIGYAVA